MQVEAGGFLDALRDEFSELLEDEADVDALSEAIMSKFDRACVKVLISARTSPTAGQPRKRRARKASAVNGIEEVKVEA